MFRDYIAYPYQINKLLFSPICGHSREGGNPFKSITTENTTSMLLDSGNPCRNDEVTSPPPDRSLA